MNNQPTMNVIPKEKAVFWLDKQGFWRNAGGRFRLKKVIDYFHAAIDRDDGDYFVFQNKSGVCEKVYFPYEDTALFVFDVVMGEDILLKLNTGRHISLIPETLFSKNDALYLTHDGQTVRFAERAMIKISAFIAEKNNRLIFEYKGRSHPLET